MNPRELVDFIRSGPAELVLHEPLRFRRRTRSNLCDFNEFLQALQSSGTIRSAVCASHRKLGITEDDWALLIKTLGSIKDIEHFEFCCTPGSRDFHPFQAVAEAVNYAHSLCRLAFCLEGETLPRDPSGLAALANALREHTALEEFDLVDFCSRIQLEAVQITALDPVLWALPACLTLRKVVIQTERTSADALKNLLQLQSVKDLHLILETDHWLAVSDEIRRGRCSVQTLTLAMLRGEIAEATEAVKAVASAILLDLNLEHLTLRMENGFTDEAGVALAEALTVNTTLRKITLYATPMFLGRIFLNTAALGGAPIWHLVPCCASIPASF
jgi:hypothetical protein